VVPWCTYTDPELAHVGLSPDEAERLGIPIETFTVPLAEVDRAILDREEEGFGRIHVRRGTDRVVGATIVAAHAGELISEFTLLMRSAKGLRTLASTIHPYPTQAELARKLAIAWRKSTFTATKRRIVSLLLRMLG
jgi:pyruvate/2-oxoglutarate dehydrogenase complex dihydrolipoamide dehydrogenase (E3) component